MKLPSIQNIAWATAVGLAFVAGMAINGGDASDSQGNHDRQDLAAGRKTLSALDRPGDKRVARGIRTEGAWPGTPILDQDGSPLNSAVADRFRSALAEHDPVRRMGLVAELLSNMHAGDAQDIVAAFEHQMPLGDFQPEFKMFLHAWGQIDGHRAVEFALDPNSPVQIDRGARSAMAGWAVADVGGATDWIESLEPGQRRNAMVCGLLDGWSRSDLAAASAYAETQPRSNERTTMIDLLLSRHLEQGGIDSAIAWFDGISGEGQNATYQARAFLRISQEMAEDDPVAAAGWIDQHTGESYATTDVIRELAAEWGKTNPVDAMAWVMRSSQQDLAGPVQSVMASWASQDPAAAAEWLRDHSGEPYYDRATHTYAEHMRDSDPALAMQWAGSIGDENLRQDAVDSVARHWLQNDNETARATLVAQGMSAEQIDRLAASNNPYTFRLFETFGGESTHIIVSGHPGGNNVHAAPDQLLWFSIDGSQVVPSPAPASAAPADATSPAASIELHLETGAVGTLQGE